jgi:Peptidase family M41
LIRKLVKYLEFQDRFTEIELSNVDSTSWEKSVASVLEKYNFNDEKPAIVLFDEIQRFNTVEPDGKPITQTKFMDFWELLSDGKLSRKTKEDLDYHLFNLFSRKEDIKRRKALGEKVEDEKLSMWEARDLQKMLSLEGDYEDMLNITQEEGVSMINKAKKKKKIYEPVNYAKTLIIISGNLDEAFNMAIATSESDVDADIFHAFTKKITIVDVKNSLSRKFRPEQVARFGNIHLIYNSLAKASFEKLIAKEFKRIITDTNSKFGIKLTIGKDLNNLVYRNGVFPVQGVRPVFSSIIDIIETNLSKYLYESIINGHKSIDIQYDESKMILTAKLGDKKIIKTPYTGRVDQVRNNNEQNAIANISVHESGHAVAYMVLFNVVPLQLKSKLANSYAGGFTFPHQIHETKESLVKKIMIFLAGGLAEDLIFGENLASVGRGNDWEKLTSIAIDYIRKYGFGEYYQANYAIEQYAYQMDKHVTDKSVEDLIVGLTEKTKEMLIEHKPMLIELSKELALHGSLSPVQVQKLANKYSIKPKIAEEGFLIIDDYDSKI